MRFILTLVDSWVCRWFACWGLKITHTHTHTPSSCIVCRHTFMHAHRLKFILLLFFAINRSLFFSPPSCPHNDVSLWSTFLHIRYVVQVIFPPFFPFISPYLSSYHTATYSQFSNHCVPASHWYFKPPHCQNIQHMRMNYVHVLSQRWYRLGHIAVVHTLYAHRQCASKYH